jgi:hypothetical protein
VYRVVVEIDCLYDDVRDSESDFFFSMHCVVKCIHVFFDFFYEFCWCRQVKY